MNRSASLFAVSALRLTCVSASAVLLMSLVGCSGFNTTATPSPVAGVSFGGSVHGGQQPVSGAKVYLFGAATSGYGSTGSSLLRPGTGIATDQYGNQYATTDANGNFGFSTYFCPSGTTQTYLLALGGNPGIGGTGSGGSVNGATNNTAIAVAAAVGDCSNLNPSTFVSINELTTVALATAAQQYAVGPTQIGAPNTTAAAAGLRNAFLLAQDLVATNTGTSRTTNVAGTGSVPQTKVDTLGNILAPCLNSASNNSAPCTSLFSAAVPAGGTTVSETFSAMLSIAKNPGNNVANINALTNAAAPFQPSLASAPNDWTLAITYSGGGMTAPGSVVIDQTGNAYIGNSPSTAGASGTDSIVGFSPTGAVLTGATGYSTGIHAPAGLAIDTAGNIWSTDAASGSNPDQVVKLTGAGALVFAFNDSTISNPQGIAIDSTNNAWVANQNNFNLDKINAAGTRTQAPVTSSGFYYPTGIGIDGSQNIFAAGTGSNTILKFNSAGTVLSPAGGYTASSLNQPTGISLDASGNVWTINNNSSTITKITNTGTLIAPSTPMPSISNAYVLAIDGAGGAWYANCRAACGANTTSPDNLTHVGANQAQATGTADGFQDSHLSRVGTAAIDATGNVWVTNNGNGTVTEFLGIAVPVVTPLAAAAANNTLGTRP